MARPILHTTGEFLAAARAIAITAAPTIDELCCWFVNIYDLAPAVQQDLLLEGAVAMVGLMLEDEEIALPEFGCRVPVSDSDRAKWLALATAAAAAAREQDESKSE
jgi:hypothetical protein